MCSGAKENFGPAGRKWKKKKKHKSWKNYVKTWRCWVSNPGPSACKADALPLSYIPTWQTMPEIRELLMQVAKHIFSYPTYYTCTFSVREKEPTTLRSVQKYQTCKYTTQCNAHLGPTSAPSCFTPQPHLGQGVTVGYVVGSQEAPMPSSNLGSTFGMPTEQKKKKFNHSIQKHYLRQDIFSWEITINN